jgi:hypothetical protein
LARFGFIPGPKPNLFPEPRLKTPQPEDTSLKTWGALFKDTSLKDTSIRGPQFKHTSNSATIQKGYRGPDGGACNVESCLI